MKKGYIMTAERGKFANICNIIFDLDGTLIDSSSGIILAANQALARLGLPARSPEELKRCIGYPLELLYGDNPPDRFVEFRNIFRQLGNRVIVDSARPLDGVEMTLGLLSHWGHRLAVATTKCRRHLEEIISRLGWENYFAAISGGDEVTHPKPDPEQINRLITELRAVRRQTVVVGDTVNDIIAARAAGLMTIGVRSPFGGEKMLAASSPDLMLDTFCQLTEYLI